MSKEIEFRVIPNYPDYSISSKGEIFRNTFKNHHTYLPIKPKQIVQREFKSGYLMVSLSRDDKARYFSVHRLVLETFVGSCPEGKETGHLNGNRHDNRIENLEWITKSENELQKRKHGTASRGSKNPNAKLTEEKVIAIRIMLGTSLKQKEIANYYSVGESVISDIKHNRRWYHV